MDTDVEVVAGEDRPYLRITVRGRNEVVEPDVTGGGRDLLGPRLTTDVIAGRVVQRCGGTDLEIPTEEID